MGVTEASEAYARPGLPLPTVAPDCARGITSLRVLRRHHRDFDSTYQARSKRLFYELAQSFLEHRAQGLRRVTVMPRYDANK